jgi:hypothetical protein
MQLQRLKCLCRSQEISKDRQQPMHPIYLVAFTDSFRKQTGHLKHADDELKLSKQRGRFFVDDDFRCRHRFATVLILTAEHSRLFIFMVSKFRNPP